MAAHRAERDSERLSRKNPCTYEPVAKRMERASEGIDSPSDIPVLAIAGFGLQVREEPGVSQSVSVRKDGSALQNEASAHSENSTESMPDSKPAGGSAQKSAWEAIDPADLKKQMARIRAVDWRDCRAVKAVDIAFLTELSTMRPSLERDMLIRLAFGSERQFRKAWRKVTSWAPPTAISQPSRIARCACLPAGSALT